MLATRLKIFRKRKLNEKERVGNFSQNVYTIERIDEKLGQKYYSVEGNNRVYLRFELLKVGVSFEKNFLAEKTLKEMTP